MPEDTATTFEPLRQREPKARSNGKLVVAIILAACVATVIGIVVFRAATGADPLAARVPASSAGYVQVSLSPSISEQRSLAALADNLPGGREQAEDLIRRAVEPLLALAPGRVSFDEVKTWDSAQVGVSWWSPPGSDSPAVFLVAETSNLETANTSVQRLNESAPGTAILKDGFITVAEDSEHLRNFSHAVDDAPLVRDRAFRTARERVGGDGLMLARFTQRPQVLLGAPRLPLGGLDGAIAVGGLDIESEAIRIRLVDETNVSDEEIALFEQNSGFDLDEDLFSWLGEGATIRASTPGSLNMVIEASDLEAMNATLDTLQGVLAFAGRQFGVEVENIPRGFRATGRGVSLEVLRDGSRVEIDIESAAVRAFPEWFELFERVIVNARTDVNGVVIEALLHPKGAS